MWEKIHLNRDLLHHISWFLGAFMLAFLVWVLATIEADPIQERRFSQVPIQLDYDPNLTIVESSRETVSVIVRATQSTLGRLTAEDITVRADLRNLTPGVQHTVELVTSTTRRAEADPQPRQITLTLEEIRSETVPIIPYVVESPPTGYQYGEPVLSESETTVRGAASYVQQVKAVRARLDFSGQRDTFQATLRLSAVDANGDPVSGVDLIPQNVTVTVPITLREDARILSVEPTIDADSLAEGYDVTSMSYDPKTIMVVGAKDALQALPDAITTQQISLDGHTADFEIKVPILFDYENITLLSDSSITVLIGIAALETTALFENIPITIIGLDTTRFQATPVTDRVTVFVRGTQAVLATLRPENITAILDLNGMPVGTHDVRLTVSATEGTVESVSRPEITVTIAELRPEETETPAP